MTLTLAEKAAYQRDYRVRRKAAGNPIRVARTPDQQKASDLWRKYRMRLPEYLSLREQQGGRCGICQKATLETNHKSHHPDNCVVDHCHTTGKVRGLLCAHCNMGLGHFFDDPDKLRSAATYLER